VAEVVERARKARENLPDELTRLIVVPVLSRDERQTEYEQSLRWRANIDTVLGDLYEDWLPEGVTPSMAMQRLYLPYRAFWSFGEKLPVVEREEELADPASLNAAYGRLASLLASRLDWSVFDQQGDVHEREELQRSVQDLQNEVKFAKSQVENVLAASREQREVSEGNQDIGREVWWPAVVTLVVAGGMGFVLAAVLGLGVWSFSKVFRSAVDRAALEEVYEKVEQRRLKDANEERLRRAEEIAKVVEGMRQEMRDAETRRSLTPK
jgi:hypothetical protein